MSTYFFQEDINGFCQNNFSRLVDEENRIIHLQLFNCSSRLNRLINIRKRVTLGISGSGPQGHDPIDAKS